MNGISVPMAAADFIPVVLFFITAIILQRDLYHKMSKRSFALLAAGSIMVFIGGTYKALWKLLYALNVCDFQAMNNAFFPMQGPGFLMFCTGLMGNIGKQNDKTALALVPAVYTSNVIFIIMQTIGLSGAQTVLTLMALKMRKKSAALCFIISFVFMLGMGYLGSRFDSSSTMNWIAQLTNIVSEGALLAGVMILHEAGLDK